VDDVCDRYPMVVLVDKHERRDGEALRVERCDGMGTPSNASTRACERKRACGLGTTHTRASLPHEQSRMHAHAQKVASQISVPSANSSRIKASVLLGHRPKMKGRVSTSLPVASVPVCCDWLMKTSPSRVSSCAHRSRLSSTLGCSFHSKQANSDLMFHASDSENQ
jgi:hypothetical protein